MQNTKSMWQELQEITRKHGSLVVQYQIEGELFEFADSEIKESEEYLDDEILIINLKKIS